MAFEAKDVVTTPTVTRRDAVTSIEIVQDTSIPAPCVKLRILVRKEVAIDGKAHVVFGRLPQSVLNAAWPGAARTFQAHLFSIIDNTVWDE